MTRKSGVNIRFIAEQAGVSAATVSRVLNNSAGVNDALAEKVLSVAESYGYSILPHKKFNPAPIALIVPTLESQHFARLVRGTVDAAKEYGKTITLMLCKTAAEAEQALRDAHAIHVSGIVYSALHGANPFELVPDLRGTPLVLVGSHQPYESISHVYRNISLTAYTAVKYLLHLGHHRIVFANFGWTDDPNGYEKFMQRYSSERKRFYPNCEQFAGYLQALEEYGIEYDPTLMIGSGSTFDTGYTSAGRLLTKTVSFDAVVATNDQCAAGMMKRFTEQGFRVPEQISIICLNGGTVAKATTPTLTHAYCDDYGMGKVCVDLLEKQIKGLPTENIVYNNTDLEVNGSTKSRI